LFATVGVVSVVDSNVDVVLLLSVILFVLLVLLLLVLCLRDCCFRCSCSLLLLSFSLSWLLLIHLGCTRDVSVTFDFHVVAAFSVVLDVCCCVAAVAVGGTIVAGFAALCETVFVVDIVVASVAVNCVAAAVAVGIFRIG
jgi:hypothetical protein